MRGAIILFLLMVLLPAGALAQRPTPEQLRALTERADLGPRIRSEIQRSGMSASQIRARLVAAGYPADLLDQYLGAADSAGAGAAPSASMLDAVRALGLLGAEDLGAPVADSVPGEPGALRTDLPETAVAPRIFGMDVFRRVSTQFQPLVTGPVDPGYRLGPGDVLVLILTGDVELAHTLEVTREGFVVIPQVGQIHVAGLTLGALEDVLYGRLSRVYSGITRSPNARTRFEVTVSRLRTNQIYVVGDVVRPGSYQVSSAGTVLTALYLAGGPTAQGSFRRVEIRRRGQVVDTLDIYGYLLRGDNAHDIRLESGDVVFVPVRGTRVEIDGAVTRPAIYELTPGETLRDLVIAAGGFEPTAHRRRIQIERVLAPAQREPGGRDQVLLDIAGEQVTGELAPAVPLEPGDRVHIFSVSERRRNAVTVRGNVWIEGQVGFEPGMRLSDAIRLAGGPKPDVYLGQVLVSRLRPDSTRVQLRSSFADSTGRIADDLPLQEDDHITVYSRTTFRPDRYVVVTGAVRQPGRVRFREGMTLRDAVLDAQGTTQDAWLAEAEIARLPADRSGGAIALTLRVNLDSTYIFDRGPNGEYGGPPGLPARAGGAPEVPLQPYDNVLIFRQPDWELQRTVTLTGQVHFPGRYALKSKTERLTDLIARAGGLTGEAYPLGAALYRRFDAQQEPYLRVIDRLATVTDTGMAATTAGADTIPDVGVHLAQRVGLDLPRAMERPTGTQNIILRAGDSLNIPEFDPTVRILGAVNAPTSVLHRPGWNVDDYVSAAGGFARTGDKGRAYVVQPSGRLESVKRRFLLPDARPEPRPGAVVFVPERDPTERKDWAGLLGSLAQILASTVAIVVVATR